MIRTVHQLSAVLICLGFMALAAPAQSLSIDSQVRSTLDLERYEIISLDLPSEAGPSTTTTLLFEGRTLALDLHRHSLRSADFQLLTQRPDGVLEVTPAGPPATYRGRLADLPSSRVAASIVSGQMTGLIDPGDGDLVGIQPLSGVVPDAPVDLHVIYRLADVIIPEGQCGTQTLEPLFQRRGQDPAGTGLTVCDLAIDADYDYFARHKSDLAATVLDIETVLNGVEAIYERDTAITYELSVIVVRTSEPDPYSSTDPGTLLGQFQNEWNTVLRPLRRDTAHLMTGKSLDGSIIGLAYVGVVCSTDWGYGLSQFLRNYGSDVGLIAHEVGHNWNAGHCDGDGDCYIMCSGLGGCSGSLSLFGSRSIGSITGFRDSRGCVTEEADPVPLPFFDDFPSTTLDPTKWTYASGQTINNWAWNEPSPPYALDLDAANGDAYRDDEVRSTKILLGGVPFARVSYATEHRHVDAGEALVVEVWTDSLQWVEVGRVVSDGTDQTDFVHHQHILPAGSYHDEFRVRFRTEVDNLSDEWFIDDVLVEAIDCPLPETYGQPTPGTAGITPSIGWEGGVPFPGNSIYTVTAEQLYGGQTGYLFTGFSRVTVDVGGVYFNVLPPWYMLIFTVDGIGAPGYGSASIPMPIPADPALAGLHFMNFFLCNDPGGPRGLAGTEGLDSTICE